MSSTKLITQEGKSVDSTENINDLIQNTLNDLDEHRAGILDNATAIARTRLVGNILSALKVKIVYDKLSGKKQNIAFLKS